MAEHHEMDEFNLLKITKAIEHKVIHHLDKEKYQVFKIAGKTLTDKQKIKPCRR